LAASDENHAFAYALDSELCQLVNAAFVQLAEYVEGLVYEPHVLVVLRLARIEYDDHGGVEGLLSDGPADKNCGMAVGKEKEGL
jgi:hypothetical protein